MKLSPIKLVTIIGPKSIKDDLLDLLRDAGISGYTYYYVHGGGERQLSGDEEEADNIKFRILVSSLLAVTLMRVVSEEFFGKQKVIAFEHDANVIRHKKFDQVTYGL